MREVWISLIILLAGCCAAEAQKTTRRGLKARPPRAEVTVADCDTVWSPGARVSVAGYEKPLNSNKESLHITNHTDSTVTVVLAELTYTDFKGNELHKRPVDIKCDIPPGATRMLSFRSWDVQNRFYYEGGPVPRAEAYPFAVEINVKAIVVTE